MLGIELTSPNSSVTIFGLFMQANLIVKLVMFGLLAASIWCWTVIIDKVISYGNVRRSIRKFEKIFWSGQSLEELYRKLDGRDVSGMSAIFMAAMREWKKSFEKGAPSPIGLQMRIDRAMDVALTREIGRMEARLGFLATIGSAAPFIGLFGTIIGIMTSFQSIAASRNTSLAVVAPGIAEALLATAIGLLSAIPAVIAYNKLSGDANEIGARLESFADEFSTILSRQIDERMTIRSAKL
ncbi:MAG: biopolymer transport protein TolQ [Candidatus Tokpelaia sp. JSC189]|nr:MAG: biopolymer transport protein TolQ [Candidatus Tokpelaia sp. JSC189]